MTETVVGLDPVTSGVSVVVAMSDGTSAPRIGAQFVPSPPVGRKAPVADHVNRTTTVAARVVEALTGAAVKPTLAVLMKPTISKQPNQDQTWARRAQLAGEIERLLIESGVPVAEIPPLTVSKWVLGPGASVRASRGLDQVEAEVKRLYPASIPDDERFRPTTIGAAAAALVAAGLPTGHPLGVWDINTLGDALILPRGWKLPDLHAKALSRAEKEKEMV